MNSERPDQAKSVAETTDNHPQTSSFAGGEQRRAKASGSLVGETLSLCNSVNETIGNFKLTRKVGTGGFGSVYCADDLRLKRRVAIKVPFVVNNEGANEYYRRVLREGRAAAQLQHSNIVRVYEVGECDGRPYIVSQLIEGHSLCERIEGGKMEPREAAKLIATITRAVHHAHQHGIVHRDLKPSNVLIDHEGSPYVNDFGIAKYESAEETISAEGTVIGTPAYMSPEQASGHSRDADRRSDVYSLGVILFEMITGERPFRGNNQMLLYQVLNDDPPAPRSLEHSIPKDLETICLKCLAKEKPRRYEDCEQLADELDRFIEDRPILARPISQTELFLRRCRRYPVVVALALALLATLLAGLAGVSWQWYRAEEHAALQQVARLEAEQSREALAEEMAFSERLLYDAKMNLAANASGAGDFREVARQIRKYESESPEMRDLEWRLLDHASQRYRLLARHPERVMDVAVSSDETMIAAVGLRTLLVWDSQTRAVIFRARERGKQLRCVKFSPDGQQVAWSGQSGFVRIVTPRTGVREPVLNHGAEVWSIAFADDGKRLLSSGAQGHVKVWNLSQQTLLHDLAIHEGDALSAGFVGDEQIISGGSDNIAYLVDLVRDTRTVLARARSDVTSVAANESLNTFAIGLYNSGIMVGNLGEPRNIRSVAAPSGPVKGLEFWEQRRALVSSHLLGRVLLWHLPEMTAGLSLAHVQAAGRSALARDSGRIIVSSGEGAIEEIGLDTRPNFIQLETPIRDLLMAPSSPLMVIRGETADVRLVNVDTGRLVTRLDVGAPVTCMSQNRAGSRIVFGTQQGQLVVADRKTGKMITLGSSQEHGLTSMAFVEEGARVACGAEDGTIRVWELDGDRTVQQIGRLSGVVRAVALSDDGKMLAVGGANGSLRTFSTGDWQQVAATEHGDGLISLCWNHDGSQLGVADGTGAIRLYDRDLEVTAVLRGHAGSVNAIAFTDSGQTMVTAGADKGIVIWDLVTGEIKSRLVGQHGRPIRSLLLSQDDALLVTGDTAGRIRIWRAP